MRPGSSRIETSPRLLAMQTLAEVLGSQTAKLATLAKLAKLAKLAQNGLPKEPSPSVPRGKIMVGSSEDGRHAF